MSDFASPSQSRFVAYLRVSTDKQGRSGLGLEAQRAAVERYVSGAHGRIVAEHVEIESGRKRDRPQLVAALADCRTRRGVLVIAKLDRLARNVAFISNLIEGGVEFVAADMPKVNRLTLHILAAVAEEEARMISARTKAALGAAKARGVQLGNPHLLARCPLMARQAREAHQAEARRRCLAVAPFLDQARRAGAVTLWELAQALMDRGVPAPRGGERWHPAQVRRILASSVREDTSPA
jgi:DNA invertase Pin-like site-specific DNA recombinase